MRSLLLALAAAAAAFFTYRLFAIRIGLRIPGEPQHIRMDCGDSIEYYYPGASTTTTVMVKVVRTCGNAARIRVGQPGDPPQTPPQWRDAGASELSGEVRVPITPTPGTIWLLSVARDETLRLECPEQEGGSGCEFEFTGIRQGGTSETLLFQPARAVACSGKEVTRIYNKSGRAVKIRIEWSSVCATARGATVPSVTVSRIEPPAGGAGEPAPVTTRARPDPTATGAKPVALWQKDLNTGETLDVTCGDGDRGRCMFRVLLVTGMTADIIGR